MKKTVIFLFLLIIFTSCKKTENEFPNFEANQEVLIDSFEYKLKNEPKIFLDFWDGMTKKDYERVIDTLNKKKILKSTYFQISDVLKYPIEPVIYKNDLIGGIIIKGDTPLYNLYQKKYNLPELIEINNVSSVIYESNPIYFVKDFKMIGEKCDLKGEFISHSSLEIVINSENYIHQFSSFGAAIQEYTTKVIPSTQTLELENFTIKVYNIEEKYDIMNIGDSHNGYPIYYYKGKKTFNPHLNKYEMEADPYNSKNRYVVNTFTNKIYFEYLGKKYLKFLNDESRKNKIKIKKEEDIKKRKLEEVYNNI